MSVTIKTKDSQMYAFIKGEIDHHTVPSIREQIDDAVCDCGNVNTLVLDFGDVSFMDSSGVGLVMGRYRFITPMNIKLRVDNLSNRDYKIMRMSGIEKLAQINQKTEGERK